MKPGRNRSQGTILRVLHNPRIRLARFGLLMLVVVALLADFIANDKPLICRLNGSIEFPAFRAVAADLGLATWSLSDQSREWRSLDYDAVLFPPIPYAPKQTDLKNANYKGPFASQDVSRWRFRHWLGTDHLGRDVSAGLVHGTRIALLIGLLSMLIAALIGIPLGALAGYFGDDRAKVSWTGIVIILLAILLCMYFLSIVFTAETPSNRLGMLAIVIVIGCALILLRILRPKSKTLRQFSLPADTLALRSIEILRSIPAFFLIFAILGMLRSPKLVHLILLIAILWSPSIIRYVRAEALKLRNQTYIQSARVLGVSHGHIVWKHIIPNALGPAMVTLAFGVGSAVLIESALSFIGIGTSPDTVSWGKMLNLARNHFAAWWMALLPGIAIFITIAIFNRLGDAYEEAVSGNTR